MSVLVVGVSHKTAPVAVLERLALDAAGVDKLVHNVMACEHVLETTALTTCNRIEVYAEVDVRMVDLSSELQILAYHEQRKNADGALAARVEEAG